MIKIAIFISSLSLIVSLGANLSNYKIEQSDNVQIQAQEVKIRDQAVKNAAAIKVLCAKNTILLGLVKEAVISLRVAYRREISAGPQYAEAAASTLVIYQTYLKYEKELQHQQDDPHSACHGIK